LSEKVIISQTTTNKKHKHTNSVEFPKKYTKPLEKMSYNTITSTISQSDKTQKSKLMNNSVVETLSNPIIMSNSEGEDEEEMEDVVTKYKKALEFSNEKPQAATPKIKQNEQKTKKIENSDEKTNLTNVFACRRTTTNKKYES